MRQIGLAFDIVTSGVAEDEDKEKDPVRLAERLARLKAQAVAATRESAIVIAADTVVCVDGELLGKPANEQEAMRMLRTLSGRSHQVMTGVVVTRQPQMRTLCHVEKTTVFMRPITEEEIRWYINSNEPYDKAGGYGIQGKAAIFVERLEGCYFNVVGLPLSALCRMLEQVGVPIWEGAENHDNTAPNHQGFATK
jgi:septum formation protein